MVRKNVYKIDPDYDHFRYLLPLSRKEVKNNELLWELFLNLPSGSSLGPNFPTFKFSLFVDSRKKKDKRRMDFNVSCWNSHSFICDDETKLHFQEKFGSKCEIFPVETDLDKDFYYVNCLTVIDAIKAEDRKKKYGELVSFIRGNIKEEIFFRDKVFTDYYVTDDFIEWAKENDIKGMRFTLKGYM